jgi:hypothetical protein
MNQQQQIPPIVKYLKSKEFDAVVEEYYHPTQKDKQGNPIFLNKRILVSREEWSSRKKQVEDQYKAQMGMIDNVFKILDGKAELKKKGKK